MADIKISGLATKADLILTDLLAVSNTDGTLFKSDLQTFANLFSTVSGVDFKGALTISQATATDLADGFYFPSESGDYVLANSQTKTVVLTNNLVILIVGATHTTLDMIVSPVTISVQTAPTNGSTSAVSSGGTFDAIKTVGDRLTAQIKSTNPQNKTITWLNANGFWNGVGVFVSNANRDISNDIDITSFNYYGFYGELNETAVSLIYTNGSGVLDSVAQVGVLPSSNAGLTLFIFKVPVGKTHISLTAKNSDKSDTEFFELKSPYLIDILDRLESNKNLITSKFGTVEDILTSNFISEEITTTNQLNITDIYLKKGVEISFKVAPITAGSSFGLFLFRADGTNVAMGTATHTTYTNYTLLEDFVYMRFFNNSNSNGFTGFLKHNSSIFDLIDVNSININKNNIDINGESKTATSNGNQRALPIESNYLKAGTTISYGVFSAQNNADFNIFLFRPDNSTLLIKKSINKYTEIILTEDFTKINFYNNIDSTAFNINLIVHGASNKIKVPIKTLVIGDSYAAQERWVNEVNNYIGFDSILNLGVGSASLRDRETDRSTYPYTSRPLNSQNDNLNVFASQIEKLKRLIAGTDLDAGEVQAYPNIKDHPNLILIEGGTNDVDGDNSTIEATYQAQFIEVLTNKWATISGGAASQRTVYTSPNITGINRTSFAGSMRNLYEELYTLFPNAKILWITPTNLTYGTGNNYLSREKSRQIELSASYLGTPVVNWSKEGNVTFLNNLPTGSGTEADPYNLSAEGLDTNDLLHPNDEAAKKLALPIAAKIKEMFNY